MNLSDVENLALGIESATDSFGEKPQEGRGLNEKDVVSEVNRLICRVLDLPSQIESNLKTIDDVRKLVLRLRNMIGIVTILAEDDQATSELRATILDQKLQVDMVSAVERFLLQIMGISSAVKERVFEEIDEKDKEVDNFYCDNGSAAHGFTESRNRCVLNLLKRNGQVTIEDLIKAVVAIDRENKVNQIGNYRIVVMNILRHFGFKSIFAFNYAGFKLPFKYDIESIYAMDGRKKSIIAFALSRVDRETA